MKAKWTNIDGLSIRYASSFDEFKENVLLLSPLPESIFAFTPIWNKLADQFNLVAIDLPGFGQSESRQDLFSTKSMAEFVIKVIDHFNFSLPHIVGPDIGTAVAMFVAANHPEKIKSVIISGGACVYPLDVAGVLKDIIEAPNLDGFKQLSVKDIIDSSLSELKNYKLPDEIKEDYVDSYEGGRLFDGMQILRNYTIDIPELDKQIEHLETPVQIIWGEKDPIVPVRNAYSLQNRLPRNKLNIINDLGHYIWEEGWADYLAVTNSWLLEGYHLSTKSS